MISRDTAVAAVFAVAIGAGALWYYGRANPGAESPSSSEQVDGSWLDHLHSQNPKVAEAAARELEELGEKALPDIEAVLKDPAAPTGQKKAALKASGLLGPVAAPLIPDMADHLTDPALTADAGVALSYVGRDAFMPLREALESDDPVVRREALRAIGKLRERAPLDPKAVVPLLLQGLEDDDSDVRAVAATYLGIVAHADEKVVSALIDALKDEDAEVRMAAATALGSFPRSAQRAIPALRRAMGDANADVAREAGVSIVKLQGSRTSK